MHWDDILIEEDETQVKRIPLRRMLGRLLPLLRPHVRTLTWSAILLLVTVATELGGPLIIRHVLDVDIPGKDAHGVLLRGLLYALLYAVGMVTAYFQVVLHRR